MPANAYPHLIFATDAETLPRTELEPLVRELFAGHDPAPAVEQGPLQTIVRLGDYTFTFWYDDDSEGLGGRHADYAPTLNRRRISRCTTMIDLSGDADPDGAHAEDARRLTEALAARPGVYVFAEKAKAFVGLDVADPFADTLAPTIGTSPESPVSPEPAPVVSPDPLPKPVAPDARPEPVEPEPAPVVSPDPLPKPVAPDARPEPAEPEPQDIEPDTLSAPEPEAAQPEPSEAGTTSTSRAEPEPEVPSAKPQEGGFFKKLFGRRR